jgi:hypothetical protein
VRKEIKGIRSREKSKGKKQEQGTEKRAREVYLR